MITAEITVAASQCKLKAHSLLSGRKKGPVHEYVTLIEERAKKNRAQYYNRTMREVPMAEPYCLSGVRKGIPILLNANLRIGELEAHADAITWERDESRNGTFLYQPTLVVGTHKISKEQKLQLAFIGYVLSKSQKGVPVSGIIVGNANSTHRIKLGPIYKEVRTVLKHLDMWIRNPKMERPSIALSAHCSYCCFQRDCKAQAVEKDDLSLLGGMTPAVLQRYQKKGIFTIHQLSFLFRPRKQRKGKKKVQIPLRYRPELRALAVRTNRIYLQELPELPRDEGELFLDIEGIPDQDFYYLIGLLVSTGGGQRYCSFWADSRKDEHQIWEGFIEMADRYPDAPIFHYGAYDSKAIRQLEKRHGEGSGTVERRLVNVNSLIYGRVYFPVRSNSLKELGRFLGATWTHPDASGLQSLVWRHRWDESGNPKYRQLLLTYNLEDCKALRLLTKELLKITESVDSRIDIDFADKPKRHATDIGNRIHGDFEILLQYGHADYDKKKIAFHTEPETKSASEKKISPLKGRIGHHRRKPKAQKTMKVRRRSKCPKHKGRALRITDKLAERVVIDIVSTRSGIRKSITKYSGRKSYCSKCDKYYNPPGIDKLQNNLFGHSFRSWAIYYRIFLRLPYSAIESLFQTQFGERIHNTSIVNFVSDFGSKYTITERLNIRRILDSPIIHVDETTINVKSVDHYVWVFTDGRHVVFRRTETREASIVHECLADYNGILISDFFPGYDSVKCRQQKCWSHLIRDINDDLWAEPFNEEFELFVWEVRNMIVPIIQSIGKYGSKRRHLNKFGKSIARFYQENVDGQAYMSETTIKYQKRFERYRNGLFTFLSGDGIPWNNNMAERALRHLAVQRKISGFFGDSIIAQYLLLLGIAQSCRFQDKLFLDFLLSEEIDVDRFGSRVHTRKKGGNNARKAKEP